MTQRSAKNSRASISLTQIKENTDTGFHSRYFDPKLNYDHILDVFFNDFYAKWKSDRHSPNVGLEGFLPLAQLGKGAFGKVFLVNEIGTNFFYACKVMDKDHIVKKKQVDHVISERKILSCIDFPNLIKLMFSRKDNTYLYLGMNLLLGGELFTYHRVIGKFNEVEARFYAAQVFLALQYLHNVQVIYRDVKPENICFNRNGYISLIDFGFAKRVVTRTTTLCGTPEYLAPELLKSTPYGCSIDWWAFGILIFEFVNGSSPFARYNKNVLDMYERILAAEYYMPNPFSQPLRTLIVSLLQVDVMRRLGSVTDKEIKMHEWFKNINWYGILNQKVKPPYIPNIKNNKDISNYHYSMYQVPPKKPQSKQYEVLFGSF